MAMIKVKLMDEMYLHEQKGREKVKLMDEMYWKRRKKSLSLVNLDDDILVWIFTRLPITTILGCRRVCKSWYLFISSSYFANSYRANPPFTSLIILRNKRFSLLELNADCNYSVKPITPKVLSNPFESSSCGETRLVGSCNGFLCFVQNDLVNVRNPLSGMSFMLPNKRLVEFNGALRTSYGFGFCPKTKRYKVVEIVKYGRYSRTEMNIFTLGIDKSWRRLVNEDAPFPPVPHGSAWFVDFSMLFCEVNGKGALHWIVEKMDRVDYLYSFDISEEKVRPVPPPVGLSLKKRMKFLRSVFLHGCLCLLLRNEENNIEFWCMKDYMVPESWTLRIIPQICFPGQVRHRWFHTVAVWKNEEVLMSLQSNSIYYCNLKQEKFTMIKHVLCDRSPNNHAAACFVPNFLPFLGAGTALGQTQDVVKGKGLLMQVVSKLTELGDGSSAGIRKLPTFILDNIFSRVPINTILCCKGVCKIWYRFLSDPCFAEKYYRLNKAVHLVLCNEASLRFLFELKVDADNSLKANQLLATTSMAKITVLGSCNGLVCMSVFSYRQHVNSICICNPLLQELTILPQAIEVKGMQDEAYGFGFSPVTGHYKILRILTRKWHYRVKTKAQVHTIGIDEGWRKVDGDFRMPKKWPDNINKARFCDVPFNRAIHWIVEDSKPEDFISAFDIDEEQVKSVLPPPSMEYVNRYTCLGILRDCLCVFHPHLLNVELWWMNTCSLVTSWTKERISVSSITLPLLNQLAVLPITSWRDGEILFWVEGGTLISYCSREKICTEINIDVANNEALIAVPYVQSFLSLRATVKNGNLEVKKMVF